MTDHKDKLFSDRLLVVGVFDSYIRERSLGIIEVLLELGETARASARELQLVGTIRFVVK